MEKIVNNHGLPKEIVSAVQKDSYYQDADIGVTTLLDTPQIPYLLRRNDVEVEAADKIQSLLGSALHLILEMGNDDRANIVLRKSLELMQALVNNNELYGNEGAVQTAIDTVDAYLKNCTTSGCIYEKRVYMKFDDFEVSGQFDKYDPETKTIEDYKVVSVFSYTNERILSGFFNQLNCYRAMMLNEGYEVENMELHMFFKDFKKGQRGRDGYPDAPIVTVEVPVFDSDLIVKSMKNRVNLHKRARNGEHIECTREEMWATEDSYAVMREGGKRALGVFDTEMEASAFKDIKNPAYKNQLYVQYRPGKPIRCLDWCPVREVCSQRAEYLKKMQS